jgi:YVTN family beta-propeller protein
MLQYVARARLPIVTALAIAVTAPAYSGPQTPSGEHSITVAPPVGESAHQSRENLPPERAAFLVSSVAALGLLAKRRRVRASGSQSTGVRAARFGLAFAAIIGGALYGQEVEADAATEAAAPTRFKGPISSQPLALTSGGGFLAVVNPDNDSVSFFDVRNDANRRIAEVTVGNEPNGVTFSPNGKFVYVANTISGTVSVAGINLAAGVIGLPWKNIKVGTEPYSLAMTPNGKKLYVANARSNNISVIDTATNTVIKTITGIGLEPRGLAISNDGDGDDLDEVVYVTNFLARPVPGKFDGEDDAKTGRVRAIDTLTDSVSSEIIIKPLEDTGFKALGNAIERIPPGDPNNPANFKFVTGAYPGQLNNIAIKGQFAYLPNTGESPNGPVRFDVNTQSLLSVINRVSRIDAGRTINMHLAVAQQANPNKLFITQPWAMAFEHNSNEGWVISAASNIAVKVRIDPTNGQPTVLNDPVDPSRVHQIKVGRNPRGIVINPNDSRAFIMNYVGRSVSVLALTGGPERVIATMRSAGLPAAGTLADKIHVGKELYNTSVGVFDPATPGGPAITGRMSKNGWGSCASCHPNGLSDNVVWIFPAGPRRTLAQHADFDPANKQAMRILNWSANRDEQEDFELNIRGVSGGDGLIVLADGVTPDPDVKDFEPLANANRRQLKVRGVNAWDAIKAYVQFGIRAPLTQVPNNDPLAATGRLVFAQANCQSCHGTAMWSRSRVRFTPPPPPGAIVTNQIIAELKKVGTFNAADKNEVNANGAPPLGADGFVPPSLLSIAFSQTFFHNGEANSLAEAMENVAHRSAGTGGVDTLTNPADRQALVRFLRSINKNTPPFP